MENLSDQDYCEKYICSTTGLTEANFVELNACANNSCSQAECAIERCKVNTCSSTVSYVCSTEGVLYANSCTAINCYSKTILNNFVCTDSLAIC